MNHLSKMKTGFKPKVAIITSMGLPPYLGGIENVVDTILHSSLKKDYDFVLFDSYRKPDPNRAIFSKIIFACRLFFSCGKFILSRKPDIVHIHFCSNNDFLKHTICLIAARILGAKTIFHLHGGSFAEIYNSYNAITQAIVRAIFKIPYRVIALSEYWAQFLANFTPADCLRIVSNPVDCKTFTPKDTQPKNLKEGRILLLGSLGKRKGHYEVLKALPIILGQHPHATVYFAGTDEIIRATEDLKRIADQHQLNEHVVFLGPVSGQKKIDLLHSSSVMILPSHGENMPISIMEGMAARLPVLASNVGALPELLENGKLGILVQPGKHEELAYGIIRVLGNPDESQAMANKAYDKIRKNYDINHIQDQINTLYSEILTLQRNLR